MFCRPKRLRIISHLRNHLGNAGEYRVSSGATTEAEIVDLSQVEAGARPENSHVQFDSHSAVYAGSVYEYEMDKYETGEPGRGTKVNYTYYPIISAQHPFNVRWDELAAQYGSFEAVPETENLPDLTTFAVLVKTERFTTVGSIPDGIEDGQSVKGLLINRIESLDSEEKKLVGESFPQVNVDSLLILEDGRKPSPATKFMGMIGGGVVLVLAGVGWIIAGRRDE